MPERLWSRTHKRLLVLLVVSLILHALALGLTVVTDNEREFSRIQGLSTENWLR